METIDMLRRVVRHRLVFAALAVTVVSCGQPAATREAGRDAAEERSARALEHPPAAPAGPASSQRSGPLPAPPHVNDPVKGLLPAELSGLPFNPTGVYRRSDPKGLMRIRSQENGWEVYLEGEAPWRGDSTPSTCTLAVYGYLDERRLVGHLKAFRSDHHSVSEADALAREGLVVVVFDERGANVVERYSQNICGLHSDLDGYYLKE